MSKTKPWLSRVSVFSCVNPAHLQSSGIVSVSSEPPTRPYGLLLALFIRWVSETFERA